MPQWLCGGFFFTRLGSYDRALASWHRPGRTRGNKVEESGGRFRAGGPLKPVLDFFILFYFIFFLVGD